MAEEKKPEETKENFPDMAVEVSKNIFKKVPSVEVDGKSYPVEIIRPAYLRTVSFGPYRFIEQNPEKDSRWAEMARDGHEICWIFKQGKYYGQVIDGMFRFIGQK